MKDNQTYYCPKCDWSGDLSQTKGNTSIQGGCPHCWVVFGRFVPVNNQGPEEQIKKWDVV